MIKFADLLHNRVLIISICGWAAAQLLKTIIYAITNKTLELERLIGDGGMPSAHSATVTAMATTAGLEYGLASPIFGIAIMVAIIVMHDAMGVRMEAGKHAKALNEILDLLSRKAAPEEKLKEFVGHTPIQVCVGSVIGFLIAFLFW